MRVSRMWFLAGVMVAVGATAAQAQPVEPVAPSARAILSPPFVDVWAEGDPAASAVADVGGQPYAMLGDGSGNFFVRVRVTDRQNPPAISVTLTVEGQAPTTVQADLVDQVRIVRALYNMNSRMLIVIAMSTERRGGRPVTLTEETYGEFRRHVLIVRDVVVPPLQVTVTSSSGGVATAPVEIHGYLRPQTPQPQP